MHRLIGLLLVVLAAWGCAQSGDEPSHTGPLYSDPPFDNPRALLEAARRAAVDTVGVRYRFEFGQSEGPSTWAEGETWMLQRGGIVDSLIRVEGRLRNWDEVPAPFVYSTDGRSTWAIDPTARSAEVRRVGAGDRSLGGLAIYGYLTEFVESQPYWKELNQAESLRWLEAETVGRVDCHVVEALYDVGTPKETRHLWSLGQQDLCLDASAGTTKHAHGWRFSAVRCGGRESGGGGFQARDPTGLRGARSAKRGICRASDIELDADQLARRGGFFGRAVGKCSRARLLEHLVLHLSHPAASDGRVGRALR